MMNVTLRKIGNSVGIIIPKEMLDQFGLKEGDSLAIEPNALGLQLALPDQEFARQVEIASKFMDKYKIALQKLAE